jgi:hypothetical protein
VKRAAVSSGKGGQGRYDSRSPQHDSVEPVEYRKGKNCALDETSDDNESSNAKVRILNTTTEELIRWNNVQAARGALS